MPLPSGSTPEEARQLLNGPPHYEESLAAEEFEIDDQIEADGIDGADRTLFGSVRRIGKNSIQIPVKHIIDPIVQFFRNISLIFDRYTSRWANPFIVKRVIFVAAASLMIGLVYFNFIIKIPPKEGHKDHTHLRASLRASLSKQRLQDNSEYFGELPHVAGSLAGHATADFVAEYFESLGLKSVIDRHDVYLSHGDANLLELRDTASNTVLYSSDLQEKLPETAIVNATEIPRTQMALVVPGEAEGPLVYANFGSAEDFSALNVENCVVLVKFKPFGDIGESAGTVASRAQALGAVGVLFMSAKHPTEPSWPEGTDYSAESIQQGSIGQPARYPGDLLSPGWPSSMEQAIDRMRAYSATIPVAAISWNDARPLLQSLKGSGAPAPAGWRNNGAPSGLDDEWWVGPGSSSTVRLVVSPISENRHQITNVFGKMRGRETGNRAVFLGARLDAMCYGSSQLSGLTVLLETAHALAELQYSQQWVPLRSVHFVVWDGTSHNFAGSTEWVESVADHLQVEGVAYVDLDAGVAGRDFFAQGNPIVDVEELLSLVELEDGGTLADRTDLDRMNKPIPGFGNHIAFDAHTGVPSVRLGFHDRHRPIPVDSCLDSVALMQKFVDPDYAMHFALAELTSYLMLELSDAPVVPFSFNRLVEQIKRYIDYIHEWAAHELNDSEQRIDGAVAQLREAVTILEVPAQACIDIRHQWHNFENLNRDPTTGVVTEPIQVERSRYYWNDKIMQANSMALDRNGISMQRNWYKNHLFGPAAELHANDQLSGMFPGIQDAIHRGDLDGFVTAASDAATHLLNIGLYLDEFGL